MVKSNLSDRFPIPKILMIILLMGCIFVMGWLSADLNSSLWSYSIWFLAMGLISGTSIGLDSAIKEPIDKKGYKFEMIETIVYEKSWFTDLPFWVKLVIFGAVLGFGVFIFYQQTGEYNIAMFQALQAPEYNIAGLGTVGNAILSGIAGFVENYAWFSVSPTLFGFTPIYILLGGLSKNKKAQKLALIAGIIGFFVIGTGVWIGYHWWRYGLSNVSASIDVAKFAFINLIWVFATRNVILPHVWHFFSNLGYRLRGTGIGLFEVFGPWVIIISAGLIGYHIYLHYGAEKGRRKFKLP